MRPWYDRWATPHNAVLVRGALHETKDWVPPVETGVLQVGGASVGKALVLEAFDMDMEEVVASGSPADLHQWLTREGYVHRVGSNGIWNRV